MISRTSTDVQKFNNKQRFIGHYMWGDACKITYCLYSQEDKKNIPSHKNSELHFAPGIVLKFCNTKMKHCFTSGAM